MMAPCVDEAYTAFRLRGVAALLRSVSLTDDTAEAAVFVLASTIDTIAEELDQAEGPMGPWRRP